MFKLTIKSGFTLKNKCLNVKNKNVTIEELKSKIRKICNENESFKKTFLERYGKSFEKARMRLIVMGKNPELLGYEKGSFLNFLKKIKPNKKEQLEKFLMEKDAEYDETIHLAFK